MTDRPTMPTASDATAAAALAGLDDAERQSLVTLAGYTLQMLEAGDQAAARDYGETLRADLERMPDERRAGAITHLNTWIELNANGSGHTLRELAGIVAPTARPTDALGDELLRQLVQQAEAEQNGARRDEYIDTVFAQLRGMSPVAQARWKGDIFRRLGIGSRLYDQLLKARGQGLRIDRPTERPQPPTHDELARRWHLARDRQQQHTAFAMGEWRRFKAGHWPPLPEDEVKREIKAVIEGAKADGIRPTSSVLASVTELARVDAAEADDVWDADPDLLVMANGTLQLSSCILRKHCPGDRITTALSFAYDSEAECPTWRAFLAAVVPDAADFLQEFAGYAITTDTQHEIAVWLYGPPGSGKSTFVEGLLAMLGMRAGQLGLADIERSSFALSNLPGKTLMVATEQPADFIRSGHVLNAIISGETVIVDRKFRDPITVTPRAKLCWALNDLPRIAEAGSGLFRRVKVVAFPPLAESARDPRVKEAIKTEGAGILNWAIEGLRRLQQRGRFEIPASVRAASDDFQLKNDVPALFADERCIKGDEERVKSSELYNAYRSWCIDNGHKPKSSTAIADDWARLGLRRSRVNGSSIWRGLRLREDFDM